MADRRLSGFLGGRTDNGLMRVMDMVLAFPALLLAIVMVTILGQSLTNAMLAVAIVSVPIYARVMRASVLSVREQDYVTAARALGDSQLNILRRRILPNAITPLIVQGTLGIGAAVLEIAALSFLGLAAVAPQSEWGYDDRHRAQPDVHLSPPGGHPGRHAHPHRARLQPARRRTARRVRPAADPLTYP